MLITLALQVRRQPPKSVLAKAAAQMAAVAVNQGFVHVRNAHAIAALKTRKTVGQIAAHKRLKFRLLHLKCLLAARDAAKSRDSVKITWRMKPFRSSGLTGNQPINTLSRKESYIGFEITNPANVFPSADLPSALSGEVRTSGERSRRDEQ